MKKYIKISVIVPIYNVEDYIKDCLDSLINQTYENIEIILVDDGSTDFSGMICDEYEKKDKRITVIHKTNGGLVSARKAGIMRATGEYVTYVDADDWIDINAYEELVKVLCMYQPDIIACDFVKEYSGFNIERKQSFQEGLYSKEQFLVEIENEVRNNMFFCPGIHVTLWSKIFKLELLRKYQQGIDDEIRVGEDMAVLFPVVLNMENIYILKKSFYHYRVRKNSISWVRDIDEYQRYLKLVKSLKNDISNNLGEYEVRIRQYLVYVLYYHLLICAPKYCFKGGTEFLLFPKIKKGDHILIYGKGIFASGIKKYIEQTKFCTIVDCLDRNDISRIRLIPEESYKYIIIAITDFSSVQSSIILLENRGIDKKKILYIQKENLVIEKLPIEVQSLMR